MSIRLAGFGFSLVAFVLVAFVLSGCSTGFVLPTNIDTPRTLDHSTFTHVLQTYVDDDGLVDYAGLQADRDSLDAYLDYLARTDPSFASRDEQLAYWINVYNAYTLELIIDHYPAESIFDAGFSIPIFYTPWKRKVAAAAGGVFTLDEVEHEIIRPRYDEPRIHYAVVCAAMSCPYLRQEAYEAEQLDAQLDDQARQFLFETGLNELSADADEIRISPIMSWFRGDFTGSGRSLQQYLARFADGRLAARLSSNDFDVKFTGYDWTLNDQAIGREGVEESSGGRVDG